MRRGELFGLLGANGAGKSTILRLLAGLIVPDAGRVLINGIDAVEQPLRVRRDLGLCTGEERSFYFRLTARQNLEFFGELAGVARGDLQDRIHAATAAVDLTADLDRRFDRYSAGMRQRLGVARALLADPQILLLDEPTRAVDPLHARELRAFVRDELVERRGKTVVLATNLLDEAWELCDRVAVLRAGRIASVAAPRELSRSMTPLVSNVYEIEVDRTDGELLERLNAVRGLVAMDLTPSANGTALRFELNDDPRALTALLQAVSANGISVTSVRPHIARPLDVFASLTQGDGS